MNVLANKLAIVDKAMMTAIKWHGSQINQHSDELYILHPMRVYIAVRNGGLDEEHQAVAWLHDVLEDTQYDVIDMINDFGIKITDAVYCMTKQKGETNEEYYHRCKSNPISRRVKVHDINENFGRNHLIVEESTRLRMAKKYSLGLDILCRVNM